MENQLMQIDENLKNVEIFTSNILSASPDNVQINKAANNSKYIPISVVENQLDEIFFGAWEIKDFHYQVVANEIVGSLQLRFFHPIYKTWIERTGCAAVQIQMKSAQKGGDGDITNVRNKITNTLEKDFPHLKAECVKNAARSIGKVFGRDLNREIEDIYMPLIDQIEAQGWINDISNKLRHCSSIDDLQMLYEGMDESQQQNKIILKMFTNRKNQLKYAN